MIGNAPDFDREMRRVIGELRAGERPRLLLHACCAPCSTTCLERLQEAFRVTAFYSNPNIAPREEYEKRAAELTRIWPDTVVPEYDPAPFEAFAAELGSEPEGGNRCFRCYSLRLGAGARFARREGFDWFCTTLSVSPYKNAAKLNEIGAALAREYGLKWLPSDFKKRGGYARSVELSRELGLYRQNYCGCVYSAAERQKKKEKGNEHG